jgi:transposase InsO family protein
VLSEHGVKIAPNTYWVARKRPPSARAVRDEQLKIHIGRVWSENLFVYGAAKVWAQLNNEGIRVARCTVERLMRDMGLSGARRGRAWRPRPTADTPMTGHQTWSTGGSPRRHPTGSVSPTSPTSRPTRGGRTSRS